LGRKMLESIGHPRKRIDTIDGSIYHRIVCVFDIYVGLMQTRSNFYSLFD